uniref:Uncharacterized protein n=1 Tax=Oryza brachyantha TaxID=4533 RepID=J3N9C3_ORYBR
MDNRCMHHALSEETNLSRFLAEHQTWHEERKMLDMHMAGVDARWYVFKMCQIYALCMTLIRTMMRLLQV